MFRITLLYKDHRSKRLKIEGRLSGSFVMELKKEYLKLEEENNIMLILDLSGVTYIESEAVLMLEQLSSDRLKLVDSPIFIQKQLQHIISKESD